MADAYLLRRPPSKLGCVPEICTARQMGRLGPEVVARSRAPAMNVALDTDDWGYRMADELRRPLKCGADRHDQSWLYDNPDKMPLLPRRPLDWASLKGREPTVRDWAVHDWLPMGSAALLAGQGGIGKTLLAQTIGTCLAANLNYFADTPKPRRVLIWAGEDDQDELHRRQLAICAWAGIGIEVLAESLIVQPYVAQDITLAGLVFGKLTQTPIMGELREQVHDYAADYVFLDSLARIFGGSENDRHQVTTFVSWLTAASGGAGVCLIGHPGKAQGAEYSGSTAWEGSVRARLYLGSRLPDSERQDEDPDDAVRYLARRKANYSAKDWVRLDYRAGVLVPTTVLDTATRQGSGEFAEDVVIRAVRKLTERGIHGNTSSRSPDFLPRLAREYDLLEGMSAKAFGTVMRQLVMVGRLRLERIGQYANRTPRLGLVVAS